jgi:tetratricopeptide (TPR) repeat protein
MLQRFLHSLGLLISSLCLCCSLKAQPSQPNSEVLVDSGCKKLAARDIDGAIVDFDKAIDINPQSAFAYFNRGFAKGAQKNLEGAISDYSKVIEIDPKFTPAYHNRGWAKARKGAFDEAIADFDEAIRQNPKLTMAYASRAEAKKSRGDYNAAIDDFDEAIRLNPNLTKAYLLRGASKQAKGDYDAALVDFHEAIKFPPGDADDLRVFGDIKNMLGDFEGAIIDYSGFIGLNPKADYPRFFRALILRRLHREERPVGLAIEANGWQDGWPKTVALYLVGELSEDAFLAQAKRGDDKVARGQCCEALYYVGMIHLLGGESVSAEIFFRKCLTTNMVNYAEYHFVRAELARLAGQNQPTTTK